MEEVSESLDALDLHKSASPHPCRLLDLPVEILTEICQDLCLHCRQPHLIEQPRDIIETARQDQRALAHLSRTCNLLRDVAQPILFHYFHSGGMLHHSSCGRWSSFSKAEQEVARWRVARFFHTAIDRRDLAFGTKALALHVIFEFEVRKKPQETSEFEILAELAKFLHGGDKRMPQMDVASMVLFPNIEGYLVTGGDNGPAVWRSKALHGAPDLFLGKRWEYLTQLVIGTRFHHDSPHLYDLQPLLRHTPNLEILIAPDCSDGYPQAIRPSSYGWTQRMEKLRVLSVNGIGFLHLVPFLRYCPKLEDLEGYLDMYNADPYPGPDNFEPVKGTLRRLCYSITPSIIQADRKYWSDADYLAGQGEDSEDETSEEEEEDESDDDDDGDDGAEGMGSGWETSYERHGPFDVSDFQALEVLEVEQIILYGPVFQIATRAARFEDLVNYGPEKFMSRLPPTLRILHIGMAVAWPELRRDLLALAGVAYQRFQNLRIVHVDKHGKDIPLEEIGELQEVMGQAGIAFRVGKPPRCSSPRGMLGPRPGAPEVWQHPSQLYRLDGSLRIEGC